jgi:hypothetical protein
MVTQRRLWSCAGHASDFMAGVPGLSAAARQQQQTCINTALPDVVQQHS